MVEEIRSSLNLRELRGLASCSFLNKLGHIGKITFSGSQTAVVTLERVRLEAPSGPFGSAFYNFVVIGIRKTTNVNHPPLWQDN